MDVTFGRSDGTERKSILNAKKQVGAFPVSFISREEEFPVLICRESAIRIQSAHFFPLS